MSNPPDHEAGAAALRVTIARLGEDGRGIVRDDERSIHVAGGTPGDVLDVIVEHESPHRPVAWARIERVVERGNSFVAPPCPHAAPLRGRCGGCPVQHVAYPVQLGMKQSAVLSALAGVDVPPPKSGLRLHPAPNPLRYRNRTNHVVGRVARDGQQAVVLGSYAPRSHTLAEMRGCLAVRPALRLLASAIEDLLTARGVSVGDETPDALRYVTLRSNENGDALVEWVARSPKPSWLEGVVEAAASLTTEDIASANGGGDEGGATRLDVVGQSLSVNDRTDNSMRGDGRRVVGGTPTVTETIGSVSLAVAATSFLQLNSAVAAEMYAAAGDWLAPWLAGSSAEAPVLWDLYCGIGGLGISVASGARDGVELMGCELHEGAVELAQQNALRNGIDGARYAALDLKRAWPDAWPTPSAVLVNPPRRGIDKAARQHLAALPSKTPIVYMSCNPTSFAYDVWELTKDSGRSLTRLEAWDMLPQTTHVEVLGVLSAQD